MSLAALLPVLLVVVVLTATCVLAWCAVTGQDPGRGGDGLLELVRLLLGATTT